MKDASCATCRMRMKYDANPKSILGRLWRWHTRFCPGWKAYMASLPADQRAAIELKYGVGHGRG